jgi:AraC-like DNA-binding protein
MARSGSRPAAGTVQGVPFVAYPRTAGLPPITVAHGLHPRVSIPAPDTHSHDFLVIVYLEQGDHVLRVDGRDRALTAGDAFVLAPGAIVSPGPPDRAPTAWMWLVFFPADAVDPAAAASLVSWRTHPLLAPFVGSPRSGGQHLHVPPEDRPAWLTHLADLEGELRDRRDGYADAARAHLTLLLVDLGRLHPERHGAVGVDPLLAVVLEVIDDRFHEPISLRTVADAVGLTAGHLTAVVRRRTGRTVQQWITERRMREARQLLADTDLSVAEIAQRVGHREAGYFVRRFRAEHGVTPGAWRRAGRPPRPA